MPIIRTQLDTYLHILVVLVVVVVSSGYKRRVWYKVTALVSYKDPLSCIL